MPEFPEVYTIVKDLDRVVKRRKFRRVEIEEGYKVLPENSKFKEAVEGKAAEGAEQIAKNIIIKLEGNAYINIHLAMSGQVLLKKKNKKLRWERVTFTLEPLQEQIPKQIQKDAPNTKENGKKETNSILYLAYRSIRMFGKVELLNQIQYEELKKKYGPPPLFKEVDAKKFHEIIRSRNTNIKNLLMDQTKIGGLGNIYATEALFRAQIHPESRTQNISLEKSEKLWRAVKEVTNEGIKNRGSTLEDELYVDIFGKKGTQQEHFQVYSREVCVKCKGKIKRKKISGRNTYFCKTCQELVEKEKTKEGLFDA
ncbi:hypothetical protein GF360_00425 [candidate division WWE3 bacterium]|nr:hypothetical protein [candidate division WWE3 bacterium]